MKKVLMVAIMVAMLSPLVMAKMETVDVEGKLVSIVGSINRSATGCAISLGQEQAEGAALVADYGSQLDAGDKTKVAGYSSLVTTAKNALDAIVAYHAANFPSVE